VHTIPQDTGRLMTVAEVAAELRLSKAAVYERVADGRIPAVRLGENGPLRIRSGVLAEHLAPVNGGNEAA
jgi:excisionase family DNA binding protein